MKINRLKVVLAEKDVSNNWLAEKLDKNKNTISRWCNNVQQPSLEMLYEIATALEVDVCDLLVRDTNNDPE